MRKQVVFHIGHHKTGSSALQATFALRRDMLQRGGISYPHPDTLATATGGVCSGNIMTMLNKFGFMKDFDPAEERPTDRITPPFFEQLARVAAEQEEDHVLFSGEILCKMSAEQFTALKECMAKQFDLHILCFVRDPFDYAFSGWKQLSKGSNWSGDFGTFVQGATTGEKMSFLSIFPTLHEMGVKLTVLRYEAHRKGLTQAFLASLGWLTEDERAAFTAPSNANPSISGVQATVATTLRRFDPDSPLARLYVRRALVDATADRDKFYDRKQHRIILDHHSAAIALINQHLPEYHQIAIVERDEPDEPMMFSEADLSLLAETASHYARICESKAKGRRLFRRLVKKLRWPKLSTRFDPETYLFLYPDVAQSQLRPEDHYLKFGRTEGRQWRF